MNIEKQMELLQFTKKIAQLSKDQSTKVGAAFFEKEKMRGYGYNGMPRGLNDALPERNERPEKYFWYEHAETNGIYNLVRKVLQQNDLMIIANYVPNMEDARALVSMGIKKLIIPWNAIESLDEQKDLQLQKAKLLFQETGVDFKVLRKPNNRFEEKCLIHLETVNSYVEIFNENEIEKQGAFIYDMGFAPVQQGIKRVPELINKEQLTRDQKREWTVSAIKDAAFQVAEPLLKGSHAYVSWCPCKSCALALTSVNVEKVMAPALNFNSEADLRWKDQFEETEKIFQAANIELNLLDQKLKNNPRLK